MILSEKIGAAGFVLAGGMSSRMGRDKALLEFEGETLVARGVRRLGEVCESVQIAGGAEGLERYGRVVRDLHAGCGPLGGIVAALQQSAYEWNVFVPVDVPFVPREIWGKMFRERLAQDRPVAAVLARVGGRVQPLCGIYARSCVDVLNRELRERRLKVLDALELAGPVLLVDFAEERWFRNVNTPEEFAVMQGEGLGG